jgi:hypothetical protein
VRCKKANSNFFSVAFFLFIFLYLLILSGLRFETGRDYLSYFDEYKKIDNLLLKSNYKNTFEWGFVLLERIIKIFSPEPYLMFFIVSAIILCLIFRELYKFNSHFYLCLLGFLSKTFFYTNLSVIRQGFAVAILLVALRGLSSQKNNKIKFIMTVLLASLFHQTAIFFLFFVISPTKKNIHSIILFCGILICIINYDGIKFLDFLPGLNINSKKYIVYFSTINERANVFELRTLYVRTIIAIYFLLQSSDISDKNKLVILLTWINLIAILFTSLFHGFGEIFNRIMIYFEVPFIFLLTIFVSSESKIPKLFRYSFVVGYYIFSFNSIYKSWINDLYPFKTIFSIYL